MAKIPIYQSRQRLVTDKPYAAAGPQRDPGITEGKSMSDIGSGISEISEYFLKVADDMQVTRASIDLTKAGVEIEERAKRDPDQVNAPIRAKEELLKAREDVSSGIMNAFSRSKFQKFAESQELSRQASINNHSRNVRAEQKLVLDAEYIDGQVNESFKAEDPITKEQLKLNIFEKIDEQVRLGFRTPTDAKKYKNKISEDLATGQVFHDVEKSLASSNPVVSIDYILSELHKADKGMYANIDSEERLKLVKQVNGYREKAIVTEDMRAKESYVSTKNDLWLKSLTGKLTREELNAAIPFLKKPSGANKGKIDEAFYDARLSDMRTGNYAIEGNPPSFNKVIDMVAAGNLDEDEINQIIHVYKSAGKLTPNDIELLESYNLSEKAITGVDMLSDSVEAIVARKEAQILDRSNKSKVLEVMKTQVDSFTSSWWKKYPLQWKIMDKIREAKATSDPDKARAITELELNKERLKKFPAGTELVDPVTGKQYKLLPDGNIESVLEKKNEL